MAKTGKKKSLFLGCLSNLTTENELYERFSEYGEIIDVHIQRQNNTAKNLTYGFVNFSSPRSASNAKRELSGIIIHGEELR